MLSFTERKPWMTLRLAKLPFSIVVALLAFLPATLRAQSPGPREYLNIPVDQAVAYVDYVGSSAETLAADLPVPNNVSVSQVVAPTVLVSFPINNKYAGASLTWPYSKLEITGPGGKVETWGFNDPAIAFHKNIFGLRALRHDEMGQYIPKTLLSFHLTVNLPLGSYDRNAPVNAGSNRWAFTPLVNLNVPLNSKGSAWIEGYVSGRFFTNNNAFQGNGVLSQDPLGIVTLWYSHNLGKKTWAAIGGYYDYGGETYVNHNPQHDSAHAFRPSVGISRQVWKLRLQLRYENTASRSNAEPWNGLLVLRVSLPVLFNF